MEQQFDLLVIGGGPGGYPAAIKAASAGRRVALIEKKELGGTCLNRGCIPTKTLLHATGLYREVQQAQKLGICSNGFTFAEEALWIYKDSVVQQLRDGVAQSLKKSKVVVYGGTARVIETGSPIAVEVTQGEERQILYGNHVLIAAGSAPAKLPIPGLDQADVLDSDTILDGNCLGSREGKLPEHMLILGGGVIGMEMATVYSNLGCQVTVIEALDRILAGMDREIAQNLKMILKKRGVEIISSAKVLELLEQNCTAGARIVCRYEVTGRAGETEQKELEADGLLVSAGRKPQTTGLFAAELPIQMERGYLKVDEHYQTSIPGIYGVGDVIGKIQLAHMATAEGLRAIEHMFDLPYAQNLKIIPSCVYTDPEIACVGMTADEAKQAGLEVEIGKYIMSRNGKSVLSDQERGFVKLVAEQGSRRLIGAQLMCARATDMIGEIQLAISQGITAKEMAAIVRAHPTFAEGIGEAAEELVKIL